MAEITDPDYLAWKAQQALNNTTRRNQFADITEYEPFDIARNNFDNPPFTWPAKQYTDSTGNQIKVQRGYMRSLITDPRWSVSESSKNRRLFFQFNPTVLVRSVQQTVGAMNPLLQDPAQLIQPVPGTATFGFELLFNREREVASGSSYAPGEQPSFEDMMVLPNGDAALASQIGVLADILVLDTITGQGISKDMLAIVTEQAQKREESTIVSREERITALGQGEGNEDEIALEQSDLDKLKTKVDSLADQYNLNIGNQAFLNPLPFRVLFSSLFMVEGVATSVEVQYQKFSATMVPTQCKVVINMYALYLGFAQRDTFLTKNLEESFKSQVADTVAIEKAKGSIQYGIKELKIHLINYYGQNSADYYAPAAISVYLSKVGSQLIDDLESKAISELMFEFYLEYNWSSFASPSEDYLASTKRLVARVSYEKVREGNIYLLPDDLYKALYEETTQSNFYLTYRLSFQTVATVGGSTVTSEPGYLPIYYAGQPGGGKWPITRNGGFSGDLNVWVNSLNTKTTGSGALTAVAGLRGPR